MYLPLSGTTSAANFNSTAYPGVCKPIDSATFATVVDFQRQLNRCAEKLNFVKIATDGSIGPLTLALFAKVQAVSQTFNSETQNDEILGDASSCILIATDVDVIAVEVKQFADAIGAPASVQSPNAVAGKGPGKASIVSRAGIETARGTGASIMDAFGNLSTVEKVAIAGTVGAIGFILYDMQKRGKRKGGRR